MDEPPAPARVDEELLCMIRSLGPISTTGLEAAVAAIAAHVGCAPPKFTTDCTHKRSPWSVLTFETAAQAAAAQGAMLAAVPGCQGLMVTAYSTDLRAMAVRRVDGGVLTQPIRAAICALLENRAGARLLSRQVSKDETASFLSVRSADEVLRALQTDLTGLLPPDIPRLRLSAGKPDTRELIPSSSVLALKNLRYECTAAQLSVFIEEHSGIRPVAIEMIPNPYNRKPSGVALVTLVSEADAGRVVDGVHKREFDDRQVRAEYQRNGQEAPGPAAHGGEPPPAGGGRGGNEGSSAALGGGASGSDWHVGGLAPAAASGVGKLRPERRAPLTDYAGRFNGGRTPGGASPANSSSRNPPLPAGSSWPLAAADDGAARGGPHFYANVGGEHRSASPAHVYGIGAPSLGYALPQQPQHHQHHHQHHQPHQWQQPQQQPFYVLRTMGLAAGGGVHAPPPSSLLQHPGAPMMYTPSTQQRYLPTPPPASYAAFGPPGDTAYGPSNLAYSQPGGAPGYAAYGYANSAGGGGGGFAPLASASVASPMHQQQAPAGSGGDWGGGGSGGGGWPASSLPRVPLPTGGMAFAPLSDATSGAADALGAAASAPPRRPRGGRYNSGAPPRTLSSSRPGSAGGSSGGGAGGPMFRGGLVGGDDDSVIISGDEDDDFSELRSSPSRLAEAPGEGILAAATTSSPTPSPTQ